MVVTNPRIHESTRLAASASGPGPWPCAGAAAHAPMPFQQTGTSRLGRCFLRERDACYPPPGCPNGTSPESSPACPAGEPVCPGVTDSPKGRRSRTRDAQAVRLETPRRTASCVYILYLLSLTDGRGLRRAIVTEFTAPWRGAPRGRLPQLLCPVSMHPYECLPGLSPVRSDLLACLGVGGELIKCTVVPRCWHRRGWVAVVGGAGTRAAHARQAIAGLATVDEFVPEWTATLKDCFDRRRPMADLGPARQTSQGCLAALCPPLEGALSW